MSEESMMAALNRLCKWRSIFAGWQLGTRMKGDPECDAVRDHREVTMLMRVEASAFLKLLLDKKIFTLEEFQAQLEQEANDLSKKYESKFPGCEATDDGIRFDQRAFEMMKNWRP